MLKSSIALIAAVIIPMAAFLVSGCGNGSGTATPTRGAGSPTVLAPVGSAVGGGTASIGLQWNVPAGNRYLGLVDYRNPPNATVLGTTMVMVDPFTSQAAVQASAAPQTDVPTYKQGR